MGKGGRDVNVKREVGRAAAAASTHHIGQVLVHGAAKGEESLVWAG